MEDHQKGQPKKEPPSGGVAGSGAPSPPSLYNRHPHSNDSWNPSVLDDDEEEEFLPPENFAMVEPGVYRSAFPLRKNFSYLARIGLRSVLTLILEEYPAANSDFNEQHGIRLLRFGMEGNKEPFRSMPQSTATAALAAVLDPANRPVLIHCNEGKHRTGTVVGLLRRHRGWALSSVLDEYILFAGAKARVADQIFIEHFEPDLDVFRHHFEEKKKRKDEEKKEKMEAAPPPSVLPPPVSGKAAKAAAEKSPPPPPLTPTSVGLSSNVSAEGNKR